jgi:hypothetical protein
MKFIGLSMSFCIDDILAGKVQEEDVALLVTGTAARDDATFEQLLKEYSGREPEHPYLNYWKGREDEGCEIARRLWKAGKIDQPRLRGLDACDGILTSRWANLVGERLTLQDGELVTYEGMDGKPARIPEWYYPLSIPVAP